MSMFYASPTPMMSQMTKIVEKEAAGSPEVRSQIFCSMIELTDLPGQLYTSNLCHAGEYMSQCSKQREFCIPGDAGVLSTSHGSQYRSF